MNCHRCDLSLSHYVSAAGRLLSLSLKAIVTSIHHKSESFLRVHVPRKGVEATDLLDCYCTECGELFERSTSLIEHVKALHLPPPPTGKRPTASVSVTTNNVSEEVLS